MNAKLTILVFAAVCLAALIAPRAACAGSPWPSGCCPGVYGTWYARVASWEDLPYFALYPPVYYRGIAPRAYGDSPVWCGGEAWGPQPSAPGPLVVVNQFVTQKAASEGPRYEGPPGPKLIKNPYYVKPVPAGDAGR
jgi:hypothetical protein